ncbi:hypothetical protein N665_0763s0019 [Sinapis alba]|nr:hypothetical protein N665_0763s0019 [Sinapis alba]
MTRETYKDTKKLFISPLFVEVFIVLKISKLVTQILEVPENAARDNKKNKINQQLLSLAIRNDKELGKLLDGVTIASGRKSEGSSQSKKPIT